MRSLPRSTCSFAAAIAAVLCASCASIENGRAWGQDASFPSGARLSSALKTAISDPWTWVPLVGSGLVTIGDADEEISDWAIEKTPIYGSQRGAEDFSDLFRDSLRAIAITSILATNSGDEAGVWFGSKAKGLAAYGLSAAADDFITSTLKDSVGRERPRSDSTDSFSSAHTSSAFLGASWAWHNLDAIDLPQGFEDPFRYTLAGMAIGTGWGRIESGSHFPSDVLAGAAIGNFLTRFAQEAFLGLPEVSEARLSVRPFDDGGWVVGLQWSF